VAVDAHAHRAGAGRIFGRPLVYMIIVSQNRDTKIFSFLENVLAARRSVIIPAPPAESFSAIAGKKSFVENAPARSAMTSVPNDLMEPPIIVVQQYCVIGTVRTQELHDTQPLILVENLSIARKTKLAIRRR
jgi:hypothetical protein